MAARFFVDLDQEFHSSEAATAFDVQCSHRSFDCSCHTCDYTSCCLTLSDYFERNCSDLMLVLGILLLCSEHSELLDTAEADFEHCKARSSNHLPHFEAGSEADTELDLD